ncbi:hypothetical protein [Mycolicibacterium diernhoferi]|uniref:Mammalian cell entry protein n=1 Tax=Mycolicibacterium diernhoferi TaxID=1801 RepID=A0A1Q4HKW5_9MYCO|nr:hypothetical protein [Mycolicibacterium diernhoferi]OJZ68156.1 hypothetical protein BRW64_00715 [Mycolicibacterium diernhoferi]OPE50741.1 hypothetical protein BV510_20510 [Mycolicibacterium diernhoferi]PEG53512.1 hypothetical protein CRI78_15460 [Mycolicibacterium diernhoferi]QYL21359.1 hypothetical protein K0O62_20370 [Mycolicibacterium diernhoferi]
MRFRKSDPAKDPAKPDVTTDAEGTETATDATTALTLAEAEAAAAEATAAAARARADEIRSRKQDAAGADSTAEPTDTEVESESDSAAEETEAGNAEDYEAAEPVQPQRRLGPALRWAAAALVVLLTGALITVSVLMVLQHRSVEDKQRQAAEYAAAAKQSVVTLMSLDFTSVDEDVQRILDNSTGNFRKEFEAQAKDFATVAKESKVVTEATATAAAVESMTDNDAVVLVTATSTVSNTAGAQQEPRSWRLAVSLTRDGDQIKMSKVEFAP